jgi:hypothetical protein
MLRGGRRLSAAITAAILTHRHRPAKSGAGDPEEDEPDDDDEGKPIAAA